MSAATTAEARPQRTPPSEQRDRTALAHNGSERLERRLEGLAEERARLEAGEYDVEGQMAVVSTSDAANEASACTVGPRAACRWL